MVSAIPFRLALAANSASSAFVAKSVTATEPTGTGVFDLLSPTVAVGGGIKVPSYVQLVPFGTDADTETFDLRLYGWNPTSDVATKVYIPQLLADVSCALGPLTAGDATANCDATAIGALHLTCDTLTLNDGAADGVFSSTISTAENMTSSILIHTRGCRYIEFSFDLTGAAACNCLWRPVD